jgi:hypothetical protein
MLPSNYESAAAIIAHCAGTKLTLWPPSDTLELPFWSTPELSDVVLLLCRAVLSCAARNSAHHPAAAGRHAAAACGASPGGLGSCHRAPPAQDSYSLGMGAGICHC